MTRASLTALLLATAACAGSPRTDLPAHDATGTGSARAEAPGELGLAPSTRAALDASLRALASAPFGRGASLAVVHRQRAYAAATGVVSPEGEPATADTPFGVASVSKLVTAARVIDLVHAGKLGLDDTVAQHLPGVALVRRDGTNAADRVRVRELLAHRAGLPHQAPSFEPAALGSSWTSPDIVARRTASWSIPLTREPGEYGYANLGYLLLAAIVERVEGVGFVEGGRAFLDGFDLRAMAFSSSELAATPPPAMGRVEHGADIVFHTPAWYTSRFAAPYNGVWASARTLARFGAIVGAAARDPAARLHALAASAGLPGAVERGTWHGLGPVHRVREGHGTLEHDGAGPGTLAWLVVVPERDLAVAVLCNGDGDATVARPRRFADVVEVVSTAVLTDPVLRAEAHD